MTGVSSSDPPRALWRRGFVGIPRLGGLSLIALLILAIHVTCLIGGAAANSPVQPEIDAIPSGLSHFWFRRFDLGRVNPPLVRSLAVVPLLAKDVALDWRSWNDFPGSRAERDLGQDFLRRNATRLQELLFRARMACIPVYLIGACVIFRWAFALYGADAAHLALLMWCSDPLVLGHSSIISTDIAAAAFIVLAVYTFVRWLRVRSRCAALQCGGSLGLALSCKFTLLILVPVFLVFWVTSCCLKARRVRDLLQFVGIFASSLLVVNSIYLFEGTMLPLKDFQFVSSALTAEDPAVPNRWARSIAGCLPVPLPANYLRGMDQQWRDLENQSAEYPSYLRGEWRDVGWWYFYIYGLLVKTPCATILLLLLAAITAVAGSRSLQRHEVVLLAVPCAVITAASASHGFTMHLRYILPAWPFLCIWASRIVAEQTGRATKCFAWFLTACSMISVGYAAPNWLSYYNEAALLCGEDHWHMLFSNTDWGQDLFRLQQWREDSHHEGLLFADCYGDMNPALAGIVCSKPITVRDELTGTRRWPDGLYALSADRLRSRDGRYVEFARMVPLRQIGGSIYVYRVSRTEQGDDGVTGGLRQE